MGRVLLTNNKENFEKGLNHILDSGFNNYFRDTNSFINLSVHKKKRYSLENYLGFNNGDYCIVIGTCIYNDQVEEEALKQIYNDFSGDIHKIRNRAIGNYIIIINKFNKLHIFVDKYQILNLYYYCKNGDWYITNSLSNIGKVIKFLTINEYGLLQSSLLVGSIDHNTIYNEVYRLFGYQTIQIDSTNKSFNIIDIGYEKETEISYNNLDDAVKKYVHIIKKNAKSISDIWGENISIHQTGGLDNRTVFCSFLSVGSLPNMMYGVGNNFITNTKPKDYAICKLFEKKFSNKLTKMNWCSDILKIDSQWEYLFNTHGYKYVLYGGNDNFFREYEASIIEYPKFIECGYFLENLRLREWADENITQNISISDFVEQYLFNGAYGVIDDEFYHDYNGIKSYTIEQFKFFLNKYNICNEYEISKDNFDEVRWIHARVADSDMVQLLNDYGPSIALFSIPELHEFPFNLPVDWRKNAKFQLKVIKELSKEAYCLPYYSHCREHVVDNKSFDLIPVYNYREQIIRFINKNISTKNIIKFKNLYFSIYRNNKISQKNQDKIYVKNLIDMYSNKYKLFKNFSLEQYKGKVDFLLILLQYFYGDILSKK